MLFAPALSVQRKQQWLEEVQLSLRGIDKACNESTQAVMLVLDVVTRWSSTHQMLREFVQIVFIV